jgi:DNA-binding NarL/FixJ family response regulator
MDGPIRILIVDDQTLWRDSLTRLLAAEDGFTHQARFTRDSPTGSAA